MAETVHRKQQGGLSEPMTSLNDTHPFDEKTRALLPEYLENLPIPIQLRVWGDPNFSTGEREAARLVKGLADEFEQIEMAILPRRVNYPYYPVIGVFSIDGEEVVDHGVRIIGLPAGLQITSLIAAIQSVSFRGSNLEAKTRIQLSKLQNDVDLELFTSADDELGTIMAKSIFGMAAANQHIRSFLIMADVFYEALWQYSIREIPKLVVNSRTHSEGLLSEEAILKQIALAIN
jgi:alkyl hydroperoxide reductase subunit AhpF